MVSGLRVSRIEAGVVVSGIRVLESRLGLWYWELGRVAAVPRSVWLYGCTKCYACSADQPRNLVCIPACKTPGVWIAFDTYWVRKVRV